MFLTIPKSYGPQSIIDTRKALGLTQEELADMLEVNRRTVARWESGEIDPPEGMWSDLRELTQEFIEDVGCLRTPGFEIEDMWHREWEETARFWAWQLDALAIPFSQDLNRPSPIERPISEREFLDAIHLAKPEATISEELTQLGAWILTRGFGSAHTIWRAATASGWSVLLIEGSDIDSGWDAIYVQPFSIRKPGIGGMIRPEDDPDWQLVSERFL